MLDVQGLEYAWIRDRLKSLGAEVVLVDVGVRDEPVVHPDVPREEVARAGGTGPDGMGRGAAAVVRRLFRGGRLHGVLAIGGHVSAAAMRELPVGVPKLMISSSGDVSPYIGGADLTVMYSVVDIAGIDRISSRVLANAAAAIAGMATGYAAGRPAATADGPIVGATLAGVTGPGVSAARELLGILGYEVLVFAGGRSYEAMAAGGLLTAALDATLLELSTELLGGGPAAGRLEAAARNGVPQVVSPGGLDMARFDSSAPDRLAGRRVHTHTSATMVRTTPAESGELGHRVAAALRDAAAPTAVYLPLRGLSTLSAPGGPFHDPAADAALFDAVRDGLAGSLVEIHEVDTDLNDPVFGRAMADHLHTILTGFQARAAAS
ncbi:Tm-1-like ATP-binding domain-containing protein [Actinomadura vinacea]|uniref:Tm-1-like ATP-binding domain-containing protein n=2 Tax=Actinomadura vinacea TaxID=115336 RepID=A0ABP5XED6_9ACTN